MNPFTESTVAQPSACPPRRLRLVAARSSDKRKRRARVGMTPGLTGVPASGGLPVEVPATGSPASGTPAAGSPVAGSPAASLLPIAGTFATAAGILATFFLPGLALALDVNAATQEQLKGVRGIGPKTAQIIIEERSRGGRYQSLEDLSDRVKGIGSKKASALQAAGLSVGGVGASSPAAAAGPPSTASTSVTPGTSSSKPSGPPGTRSVFRLPSQAK